MWVVRNDHPPSTHTKNKHMKPTREFDFTIPAIALLLFIILVATSCSPNGYGCHGRSKIMTRVR